MEFFVGQKLSLPNDMRLTIRGLETNYKTWKVVIWVVDEIIESEKRVIIKRMGRRRKVYFDSIESRLDFLKEIKVI